MSGNKPKMSVSLKPRGEGQKYKPIVSIWDGQHGTYASLGQNVTWEEWLLLGQMLFIQDSKQRPVIVSVYDAQNPPKRRDGGQWNQTAPHAWPQPAPQGQPVVQLPPGYTGQPVQVTYPQTAPAAQPSLPPGYQTAPQQAVVAAPSQVTPTTKVPSEPNF